MFAVLQIMVGLGLSLLGAMILTYQVIEYSERENRSRNRTFNRPINHLERHNETRGDFFVKPGEHCCPICLETMDDPRDMRYLHCGHALHHDCFYESKLHTMQCPE